MMTPIQKLEINCEAITCKGFVYVVGIDARGREMQLHDRLFRARVRTDSATHHAYLHEPSEF